MTSIDPRDLSRLTVIARRREAAASADFAGWAGREVGEQVEHAVFLHHWVAFQPEGSQARVGLHEPGVRPEPKDSPLWPRHHLSRPHVEARPVPGALQGAVREDPAPSQGRQLMAAGVGDSERLSVGDADRQRTLFGLDRRDAFGTELTER